MSANTKIEWADHTFNPWVGCAKVSPACDHCYAESWAKRSGMVKWGVGESRRRTSAANWRQPLKWDTEAQRTGTRPRVFCASLADVFDNAVDPQWRADLFAGIMATPHLDWLLLTKRIGNAKDMIFEARKAALMPGELYDPAPWPNVWIGATVVNQEEADRDIPKLLKTPATKRFLSMEPLLSDVRLGSFLQRSPSAAFEAGRVTDSMPEWTRIGSTAVDWVIVGGESGPGARPMHPDWARSLRDQCAEAGVAFHLKQWGEWLHSSHHPTPCGGPPSLWQWDDGQPFTGKDGARGGMGLFKRVGKKAAGRLLDGRSWDEVPQ